MTARYVLGEKYQKLPYNSIDGESFDELGRVSLPDACRDATEAMKKLLMYERASRKRAKVLPEPPPERKLSYLFAYETVRKLKGAAPGLQSDAKF